MNGRVQLETRVHPQPVMRNTKFSRSPRLTARLNKPASMPPSAKQAEELMELAVDAAQSRQLPEFLQRFASRAARMLDAAWGGVAVFRGRETDLYQANRAGITLEIAHLSTLIRLARESRREIEVVPTASETALSEVPASESSSISFVPIIASDHEPL